MSDRDGSSPGGGDSDCCVINFRHERQTVAMALAAALDHIAGPKAEMQQHAALRGLNAGTRAEGGGGVCAARRATATDETDDELFAARLLWSEINGYHVTKLNVTDAVKATPGIIVLDAKGVDDAVQNSSSTAQGLTAKRSGIELL